MSTPTPWLLDRLLVIHTPDGYEDLANIADWAGTMARCDWHQDVGEWRLTMAKIWDLATWSAEEASHE